MLKNTLLAILSVLILSAAAAAQEELYKVVITLDQQESQTFENISAQDFSDRLSEFLEGSHDGKLDVSSGEQRASFSKTGSKVVFQEWKAPQEMTVQQALDDFVVTKLTACMSNLKNLGTANEMWSTDYEGVYATDIKQLSPDYLIVTPTCPTTDSVYGYRRVVIDGEKLYEFSCTGDHAGQKVEKGYPRYNGKEGLVQSASQNHALDVTEY